MGEIADMILDGTMCQGCGEWLHDGEDGDGFPGWCPSCQPDDEYVPKPKKPKPSKKKPVACPSCGKKCKDAFGLKQHTEAKHATQGA